LVASALGAVIQWMLPYPTAAAEVTSGPRDLAGLSARDVLWRLALEATLEAPALGIGPGQFTRLGAYAGAHPHSWPLQLSSEWGLPALAAVLGGLVLLLRRLYGEASRLSAAPGDLLAAATLSVLVGLASGLVDGTLVMPTSQVMFAAIFGLMLGVLQTGSMDHRRSRSLSTAARFVFATAVVIAATFVIHQAITTYREQEAEKSAFSQRFPGKWLVPRFWESGLKLLDSPATLRR
jgi:hypothetical protein